MGARQLGLQPEAQWLANRGYAVLQVNFRGSTGFGKKFLNAGNREWAGKMHDDLLDAVDWAVKQGYADPKKVAIMGGSYGGYATLVGLTFTPDVFACGVDIVGPSNLVTLLKSIPPYWEPMKTHVQQARRRHRDGGEVPEVAVAAVQGGQDQEAAADRPGGQRPARQAGRERADRRGDAQEQARRCEYVLFPDEGHGFARPENRLKFYAIAEEFLAKHLGGRAEPAGDVKGATGQMK